jgi:hypothetical protein
MKDASGRATRDDTGAVCCTGSSRVSATASTMTDSFSTTKSPARRIGCGVVA